MKNGFSQIRSRVLWLALLSLLLAGCATTTRHDGAVNPRDYSSKPWLR